MSDPTKPNEGDNSALYVGLVVGVLVIYAGCIIIRCSLVKRTMTRERVRLAERRAALRAVRRELQVRNAEGLERQDILWHARVLAILFPEKVTVTETVTTMDDALTTTSDVAVAVDAHHLMYDPESQRYQWTDEFLADPTIQTCSICMEPFGTPCECLLFLQSEEETYRGFSLMSFSHVAVCRTNRRCGDW